MKVWFVRHGETDGNVAKRHQHEDTNLNEKGIIQANETAAFLAQVKPTHLISSKQVRAVETAGIIANQCADLNIELSDLFVELVRPQWLIGHRFTSFTTLRYIISWYIGVDTYGGESYSELRKRIVQAKGHLETLPDNALVVVVSHSVFTNFFIEHLCNDRPMSLLQAGKRLHRVLRLRNTSVVEIEFNPEAKKQCSWTYVGVKR